MNREQGIIASIVAISSLAVAGVVAVFVRGGNNSSEIAFAIMGLATSTVAGLFAALTGTQATGVASNVETSLNEHKSQVSDQIAAVTDAAPARVEAAVQHALADKVITDKANEEGGSDS